MKLRYLVFAALLAVLLVVATSAAAATPTVTIDSGPSGIETSNDATFTFSSVDLDATFDCELDSQGPAACNSGSETYNNLPDGNHSFRVTATASDGSGDTDFATRNWTINTPPPPDTTPPTVTIVSANPSALGAGDSSTDITWHADEDGAFEIHLGAGCGGAPIVSGNYNASANKVSTVAASDLAQGANTIRVCVTDAATNTGSDAIGVSKDTGAPVVSVVSASPNALGAGDSSTAVTWHASEDGSFSVRVGGSGCSSGNEVATANYTTSPANRTTNVAVGDLAQGANTIRVCVTDAASNTGFDTTVVSRDTVAPTVSVTSVIPATLGASGSSIVRWTSDEGGSFSVRVGAAGCGSGTVTDSGNYTSGTRQTTVTASELNEGANAIRVCLTDAAGNQGVDATAITQDLTPPDTSPVTAPASPTNVQSATFNFTSPSLETVTFQCKLDGGSFTPCTSPKTYGLAPDAPLSAGARHFEVRAVDSVGNVDPSPAIADWTIDITPGDNMRSVFAKPGDGLVVLTYAFPPGINKVQIKRAPAGPGFPLVRRKAKFVDRTVRNGRLYRYELRSLDPAGNLSDPPVVIKARPRDPLISPRDGASVRRKRPPLFRWVGIAGAKQYDLLLYVCTQPNTTAHFCARRRKVLSVFPVTPQYQLPRRWRCCPIGRGHRFRLERGHTYNWFVYPWLGSRYGGLVGQNWFKVR